jgi:hypothetical protein
MNQRNIEKPSPGLNSPPPAALPPLPQVTACAKGEVAGRNIEEAAYALHDNGVRCHHGEYHSTRSDGGANREEIRSRRRTRLTAATWVVLKLELKLKRLRGLLSYIPRIPLASATISATAGILPTVEPFSNPGWAF